MAIPIPYHHSNLQSEEMIYYVDGNFSSRKGIEVGSVTLHPSGIPHGPHPGLAEKSIGMAETHELAVMCDTFHPLKLTKLAKALDDGRYAYSWYTEDGVPRVVRRRPGRRHLALLDASVGVTEDRVRPVRRLEPRRSRPRSARTSVAAIASSRCPSFVAPTIGAVTPGLPSSQASATCAGGRPALVGDLANDVDDVEVGVVVQLVGDADRCRPHRGRLRRRASGCRRAARGRAGSTG